jgi:hypothetical protein
MRSSSIARWLMASLGLALALGCNDDSCPADYPVARDGACYRADGGVAPSDAGTGDGSTSDDGAMCMGTHPLFDATRRWCDTGSCYCGDGVALDVCYPEAAATACCPVAVVCGPPDGGAPADDAGTGCMGQHPNVEGTRRFCDPGSCYCGDAAMGLDVCYVAAEAVACCPVTPTCE